MHLAPYERGKKTIGGLNREENLAGARLWTIPDLEEDGRLIAAMCGVLLCQPNWIMLLDRNYGGQQKLDIA
jgi:hypothetical protein